MSATNIDWADLVWNWGTGCTKCSAGCLNCYMFPMAKRLKMMGQEKYRNEAKLTIHEDQISLPFTFAKKPKKHKIVFVNSMSDTLHPDVPNHIIQDVFRVMNEMDSNPNYTFLILTKRAERIPSLNNLVKFTDNIFMGVSIEDSDYNYRADFLRTSKAKYKFISAEPLLDDLEGLKLHGIDWLIVGGESGKMNKIRKMELNWGEQLLKRSLNTHPPVTFFYKQGGSYNKCPENHKKCKAKSKGCQQLNGKYYQNFPQSRLDQVKSFVPKLVDQIKTAGE